MKRIIRYFLQGLLFIAPIYVTLYVIYIIVKKIDDTFNFGVYGLGLLLALVIITLVGFFASTFFAKPIISWIEELLNKTPLVKIIYQSIKDLINAFVGEKKKFNIPVRVKISKEMDVEVAGFMTREEAALLGQKEKVCVYLPHSYNFSGQLIIVPRENVTRIDAKPADVMRFVVSGGVLVNEKNEKKNGN